MKLGIAALVVALAEAGSPISKVVKMLEDLKKTAEKDGKLEQKSFMTYQCWFTNTKKEKEAQNKANETRVAEIDVNISDLENGKELTSERADAQKALETVMDELNDMKAQHEAQKKDFETAEKELNQGIDAMKKATDLLKEGSRPALLLMNGVSLTKMSALAATVLEASEAAEFKRTLQPENKDWKKLNEKKFLKKYSSDASARILDLIAKMNKSFGKKLHQATKDWEKAKKNYTNLSEAKEKEKKELQDTLAGGAGEKAAKEKRMQELNDEKDMLTKQIKDNKEMVEKAEKTYEEKKKEFKLRAAARAEEQKGLAEAINILHSDDARDLFRSSAKSRTVFLQIGTVEQEFARFLRVVKDARRRNVAIRELKMAVGSGLDKVIEMIKKMIESLKKDDTKDDEKEKDCITETKKHLKAARESAIAADKNTDAISLNNDNIEAAEEKIKEAKEAEEKAEEDKKQAEDKYAADNKIFDQEQHDDTEAAKLVLKAKKVLEKTYKQSGKFLQMKRSESFLEKSEQEPPKLGYSGEYKGAAGGGNIVSVLDMIHRDLKAEIDEAEKDWKLTTDEHKDFVKKTEDQIKDFQDTQDKQKKVKADLVKDNKKQESEKKTNDEERESSEKQLANQRVGNGCDFLALNIGTRKKNRQLERDGLYDALTILEPHKKVSEEV